MGLLNAMQKMSIEWIRLPKRFEMLATTDAVFVKKIDVEELREETRP
jgi:hypothetical protein